MDIAIKLIVCLLTSFAAAGIGSLFTYRAVQGWYKTLRMPRFTPPNWVFGPVWTTLYVLMAISVFLVWRKGLSAPGATLAFTIYWTQLAINALWTIVFFGLKSKGGGVVIIAILWLLILATIVTFFRVSAWAGALLVPYIVWVTIATYLNVGAWRLNRGRQAAQPNTAP